MANLGFIKLQREILEHWLWTDKPFSKGQAWIDLLLLAQYKDNNVMVKGKLVKRNRGEVHKSIVSLADRWGWSRPKVKRFLELLEKEKMITLHVTANDTALTIEKYSKYQNVRTADVTPHVTTHVTPDVTTHVTQLRIDKKDKKRERIRARGEFNNVLLTDDEYEALSAEYENANEIIENLSNWKARKGIDDKGNDYAKLKNFAKTDGIKKPKQKDQYAKCLAEALIGCRPASKDGLTDEQYEELTRIADEAFEKERT